MFVTFLQSKMKKKSDTTENRELEYESRCKIRFNLTSESNRKIVYNFLATPVDSPILDMCNI